MVDDDQIILEQLTESILSEARRNPDQNPRISVIDKIYKYRNDRDMYLTFTNIEYVGIHPTAFEDYDEEDQEHTIMGVYVYPCDKIVETYLSGDKEEDKEDKHSIHSGWYFSENKYANFIKYNGKGKYIPDLQTFEEPKEWLVDNKEKMMELYQEILNNKTALNQLSEFDNVLNIFQYVNLGMEVEDIVATLEDILIDFKHNEGEKHTELENDLEKNLSVLYQHDEIIGDKLKNIKGVVNKIFEFISNGENEYNIEGYNQLSDEIERLFTNYNDLHIIDPDETIKGIQNMELNEFTFDDLRIWGTKLSDKFEDTQLLGKNAPNWTTKILLRCGYSLVVDRKGGAISDIPEERVQGIFIDSSAFDLVERMDNDISRHRYPRRDYSGDS